MYIYDDYEVTNTKCSFICKCDDETVRIDKRLVEKFSETGEDLEAIVICLAIIELTRISNREVDKKSQVRIIATNDFEIAFKKLLREKTIEEIIGEMSGMKYHEIINMFDLDKE